jgi:sporulation protein YlmC with PRC-barrel domain
MAGRDNPNFLSADTLKGDKVVNEAGDDLGKIEEFMIDLDNGRVAYTVLSFGGFLGMGDKLFAIPWQAFSLRLHEHAFTLNVPKDVLKNAQGFDKNNWPVTREELSRTYTYYGYQPYWQTGVTGQARQTGTSTGIPGEIVSQGPARTESRASRESPDFLSADSIKSDKVVNEAGDDLGKIKELMIDLDNGRIGYAVLSFGGFLGMGDKLFAIPWQALSLRLHEHAFTLNVPKDVLKNAQGFDKDKWPITREELSRTYTYYGYQPYWQAEVAGQARTYTEMPGETESERTARMERERQTRMPRDRI